ncbi:hypothetical protein [Crossiella sp. S99.1]|nr:hypothetical protein [Crossiella sp. S99.1]
MLTTSVEETLRKASAEQRAAFSRKRAQLESNPEGAGTYSDKDGMWHGAMGDAGVLRYSIYKAVVKVNVWTVQFV